MQLCALDLNDDLIFAHQARKHQNYFCLECRSSVRLRKGGHRQPHYYHTSPNRECRQHGKGMAHLLVQYFIKQSLPEGEASIECRFPSINRIADVAWLSKKIIFEVQYSPISAKEVLSRNSDYSSLGYQVVWILFDGRYNQRHITPAEDMLKDTPHYFTNMNASGEGIIYDQFSLVDRGRRIESLPDLKIDIRSSEVIIIEEITQIKNKIPKLFWRRIETWSFYFYGDCIHNCLQNAQSSMTTPTLFHDALTRVIASHQILSSQSSSTFIHEFFKHWIIVPYRAILRLLIERACR